MNIFDGLKNIVANLGTGRDKAAHTVYVDNPMSANELLTTYRNSWLARAIVDYPAEDATRKWRYWRAEADQITLIERLESRLNLQRRVYEALIAARLYGGAAIYINTGAADQESPLQVGEEIKSLVVLTPNSIQPSEIVRDIDSEYYGLSEYYTLQSSGRPVYIHASRLVVLYGAHIPKDATVSSRWGDSVLQSAMDSVKNVDTTMANIASLVFEAKVDVFQFDGFAQILADNQDDLVLRRLNLQAAMKGINGAVVIDKLDSYDQKTANFSGLPEVITKFMDTVSGAARIPVTRLYGRSAVGLSGSGDGDERVYFDRIGYLQSTEIGPAMAHLDDCIIAQALGNRVDTIYYEWAPLRQLSEAERAKVFVDTANAARALAGGQSGEIIPMDALSDAVVNELTEQGVLPGLDQAIEKYGSLGEQNDFVGGDATSFSDAAPRSLYVYRKVLNAKEIRDHYEKQGIGNLIDADDMHVTITYSRTPVDWMRMGESWASELTAQPGGPRVMEAFGHNNDTAVLSFSLSDLTWRHDEMVQKGASWDWPEYQPHVTISYGFEGDVSEIDPWQGEIRFGPEIFEEVNENWSDDK